MKQLRKGVSNNVYNGKVVQGSGWEVRSISYSHTNFYLVHHYIAYIEKVLITGSNLVDHMKPILIACLLHTTTPLLKENSTVRMNDVIVS